MMTVKDQSKNCNLFQVSIEIIIGIDPFEIGIEYNLKYGT